MGEVGEVTVYNRGEWKELEKKLEEILGEIEDIEESILIIGRDFNIRTGELGGGNEGEEDRRSRDRIVSNSGKNLIGWIQDKGWYILNGRTKGDWRGEFTYAGARGSIVIDYVFVNERAMDRIIEFKIESRVDSDHMPLRVRLKKKEEDPKEEEGKEEEGTRRYRMKERISWSEEAIEKYRETTDLVEQEEGQESWSVEERWQKMKRW